MWDCVDHGEVIWQHDDRNALEAVRSGFAKFIRLDRPSNGAFKIKFGEPVVLMAAVPYLSNQGIHTHQDLMDKRNATHSPFSNTLEMYITHCLRSQFSGETRPKLCEVFANVGSITPTWMSDSPALVVISEDQVLEVPNKGGPSQCYICRCETGTEVLEWLTHNTQRAVFCLAHNNMGPDILFWLWFNGKRLLVAMKIKSLLGNMLRAEMLKAIASVTPYEFWRSQMTTCFQEGCEIFAAQALEHLSKIPNGLDTGADYPVLRVVANWPGDVKLHRSTTKPWNAKSMDEDNHPFVGLNRDRFRAYISTSALTLRALTQGSQRCQQFSGLS
ncbi:hypothetical protein BV25DRAFT_1916617 [Artomyces pyxidatus]|uniref:Uncharacterized protein n=1 Tax=Artomyces pyxidatus TaxID=48021 RepID=A0ACB8SYB2_9AGAM|nr:hypothetical protein BV25DRAFT_1916617 [Artomyces pyxidatus]